jgi:orotate phosphoribosyltransferase
MSGKAEARARLRDIIAEKSQLAGTFKLASGGTSGFFFDMKPTLMDPEGSNLVAELILDLLKDEKVEFVGGLELGAVPLAAIIAQKSHYSGRPVPAFLVRKEPKSRGTEKVIEGNIRKGAEVVILEDVTTKGNSALKAVEAARAEGCVVRRVVTVVDRLDGARDNLKAHGLELSALFTKDDFQAK